MPKAEKSLPPFAALRVVEPQDGGLVPSDARPQARRAAPLQEVEIPGVEALHLVVGGAQGGEHDHGGVRAGLLQFLAHVQPIDLGQDDIGDDEAILVLGRQAQPTQSIVSQADLIAIFLETPLHERGDAGIIVDD